MSAVKTSEKKGKASFEDYKKEVLRDYTIAQESREASYLGRREVLTGKAKFGIFGDGKEVAQLAMAKFFQNGDFRSGYYRDQTFMMSIGELTIEQFFAGLYAHTNEEADPMSAGRQMGGHFATPFVDKDGRFLDLVNRKNSSSDISPTGSQMPRLLGLAYASKFFRNNKQLAHLTHLSHNGNEVAFGTIGDSSTSEGLFWETINAAGVLSVPMVVSVWDDGHGISVPKKYQTTKESISEILKGFQRDNDKSPGYEMFKTKGWDYAHLCATYEKAVALSREQHVPVLIHVEEVTQPQGHSTSGSHERYKTKERLQWEQDFDPLKKFREFILESAIATPEELDEIENQAKKTVRDAKSRAWKAYTDEIREDFHTAVSLLTKLGEESSNGAFINKITDDLKASIDPMRKEILSSCRKALRYTRNEDLNAKNNLSAWIKSSFAENHERYSSLLYSESNTSALRVKEIKPIIDQEKLIDGREILRYNFDKILENRPEVMIFGEDSGKIGGVNQGLEGLQAKYGEDRVFDTGIREATILGQGIGLSMRGLRPIAEIQYLDYLLYALQIMSDDLCTLRYRTKGKQIAPLIVRTRGHRLEGIWHSGSPMGMILSALRGMHVCVPRNMTQAAGFYNTLLKSDDPALVIESLNGYRLKEKSPINFGEYTVPLGTPEVMCEGEDITIITYGSMVRMVEDVARQLLEVGISAEVIDVQTLLPFDINHRIVESLKKTNRLLVVDEDVPGGASAFILQRILEDQNGYYYLDSAPKTLTAKDHRPAYGSDGDYFSKPSNEDIFETAYAIMQDADAERFPSLY